MIWAVDGCSTATAPCIPQLPITALLFDPLAQRDGAPNPVAGLMAVVERSIGLHSLMQLEPITGVSTVLAEYPAGAAPVLWGAQYDAENRAALVGTCSAAALSNSQTEDHCKLISHEPSSGVMYGASACSILYLSAQCVVMLLCDWRLIGVTQGNPI